jgi:hypothetical protein
VLLWLHLIFTSHFQLPEKDVLTLPSKRTHGETSEGKSSVDISDIDLGSAKVENAQQVCLTVSFLFFYKQYCPVT